MKILLVAVNAKYIHTCPAVFSLRAYARKMGAGGVAVDIAEYTINDRYQDVLSGILSQEADVIAFSTYIWNTDRVQRLLQDIRDVRQDTVQLWAGGPEATWYPALFLQSGADLCMCGEGEIVFHALVTRLAKQTGLAGQVYSRRSEDSRFPDGSAIPGLAFMQDGELVQTGMAPAADLEMIQFLYDDLSLFEHRIIYYEASRGCPFSCAYCLSGRERGIRYKDIRTVEQDLQFFLDHHVSQVKFIDRTFNANPDFAMRIWTYIRDHDNGVTNFHFEIEGQIMTQAQLGLVSTFRPGLVQMEIGVQSANPATLRSVHRSEHVDRVRTLMEVLGRTQNINLHLDLIAGLPYEDMQSFRRSFQTVYAMRPHQLQLGFLKLLKGTELYDRREEYGLVCSRPAPYEVLKTRWLSFAELEKLHRISDRVEEYVNSQGFRRSLPLAEAYFEDAFSLFEELDAYYGRYGYDRNRPSVQRRYEIFADFMQGKTQDARLMETIRFDRALHVHPSRKMVLEETFDFGGGPVTYQFDHNSCSPVNGEAECTQVEPTCPRHRQQPHLKNSCTPTEGSCTRPKA